MRRFKLAGRSISITAISAGLGLIGLTAIGVGRGFGLLRRVPDRDDGQVIPTANDRWILIAGGYDSNNSEPPFPASATAELYDLDTRQFSPTRAMTAPRVNHTSTLLRNGKVLIAGGATNNDPVSEGGILSSAELYDPATGTFTATGSMNFGRVGHTATLLQNGQVLIAGGFGDNGDAVLAAELYDPKLGTFTKIKRLTDPHVFPTATRLANGQVLIAGGKVLIAGRVDSDMANLVQDGLNTAELYSSASGSFTCAGGLSFLGALCNQSMLSKRVYHTATLLRSGRVLLAGGAGDCLLYKGRPELYDPALGAFEAANDMVADREQHTATLLNEGTVLFVGGLSPCRTAPPVVQAEIYDPEPARPPTYIGSFSATGDITEPRAQHTAVLLSAGPDAGGVLIAGGSINGNATAELYVPASGTFECIGGVSANPPVCNASMTQARQGHTATLLAPPAPIATPAPSPATIPGVAAAATPAPM